MHRYTTRNQLGWAEKGTSGQSTEEDAARVYGYTGTQCAICQAEGRGSCGHTREANAARVSGNNMTKCVKPLRHLATSKTKSSKWSVLIGQAGTKSD